MKILFHTLLIIFIAGIAGLANVVCGAGSLPVPIVERLVGQTDDETLVIGLRSPRISSDGGMTWRLGQWCKWDESVDLSSNAMRSDECAEIKWGQEKVETPRGTHAIQEGRIVLITAHTRHIVYSPPHLEDEADVRFNEFVSRRDACYGSGCSPYPINIVYHTSTGNVVASMGIQGPIVVDKDGHWKHVTEGFSPTEFSTANQMRTVFSAPELWGVAVALALAATATVLAFLQVPTIIANRRIPFGRRVSLLVAPLIMVPVVFAAMSGFGIVEAFGIALFALLLLLPCALRKEASGAIGLAASVYAVIACLVALKALFSGYVSHYSYPDAEEVQTIIGTVGGIALGLIALVALSRSASRDPQLLVTVQLAMVGLYAMGFLVGIVQGFDLGAAKLYALALVLAAALFFGYYLYHRQGAAP